jgi:hypothetical protein
MYGAGMPALNAIASSAGVSGGGSRQVTRPESKPVVGLPQLSRAGVKRARLRRMRQVA